MESNENITYEVDMNKTLNSNLFEYILNGDLVSLKPLINKKDFPFWTLKDNEGFTCLIRAIFLNKTEIGNVLIDTAKTILIEFDDGNSLHAWINQKADNGFNAIHYASFRGNVRLIEKLIEHGADMTIKNNNGLNVIHMAAQGDKPNVLVYFKEKYGMKIDCLDAVDSTPLHWCCYMGAENSLDYLVSWNVNLNAKDKDGFTPLHLAVMTEKSKIIKKLIRIGADLDSKDSKNRKPMDLAVFKDKSILVDAFNQNMNYFSCKFSFNEKIRKQSSWGFKFIFLFFLFLLQTISIVIILPFSNSIYRYELSLSLFITIIITFLALHFSDSRYTNLKIDKSLSKLAIEGEPLTNICPYCSVYKSALSRHCYTCNKCIEDFDHHCIWIDNCIGKRNYNLFLIFLIFFLFKMIETSIHAIDSNMCINLF